MSDSGQFRFTQDGEVLFGRGGKLYALMPSSEGRLIVTRLTTSDAELLEIFGDPVDNPIWTQAAPTPQTQAILDAALQATWSALSRERPERYKDNFDHWVLRLLAVKLRPLINEMWDKHGAWRAPTAEQLQEALAPVAAHMDVEPVIQYVLAEKFPMSDDREKNTRVLLTRILQATAKHEQANPLTRRRIQDFVTPEAIEQAQDLYSNLLQAALNARRRERG